MGVRTAAAVAVRAARPGESVVWALDASSALAPADQVRALAEGAVLGGYDPARWQTTPREGSAVPARAAS